ncbi:hypothetical protein DERP_014179 [Dermatophagoides pteronyssinus]|uniref:Uncharacterized protein n=1 Tax=Dermatophagoides pteronyssinus TaxID=6956 RepID=A0ABQ8IWV5_DERPT|nr:hypothetical protein DERP_014179 [Dermatophagoides pteronyssinus]
MLSTLPLPTLALSISSSAPKNNDENPYDSSSLNSKLDLLLFIILISIRFCHQQSNQQHAKSQLYPGTV